jgi:hypothetical protein
MSDTDTSRDCAGAEFPEDSAKYRRVPNQQDDGPYESRWSCVKCRRLWKVFFNPKYDTYPSFEPILQKPI